MKYIEVNVTTIYSITVLYAIFCYYRGVAVIAYNRFSFIFSEWYKKALSYCGHRLISA